MTKSVKKKHVDETSCIRYKCIKKLYHCKAVTMEADSEIEYENHILWLQKRHYSVTLVF